MIKPCFDTCLEKLKGMVLLFAKFDYGFDAEMLKGVIFEKTGRDISVNALNMAFGFEPARFKPSAYTLDTLSIYCGYEGWNNFYSLIDSVCLPAKL